MAKILGRQGEESWAPWGVVIGRLDKYLKIGRVVNCINSMFFCPECCVLLLHVAYLFLYALLMISKG